VTTEPAPLPPEVAAALHRLDDLVRAFAEHPDASVQDRVIDMLQAVDVLHRGALQRLGALLDAGGLRADALADPQVALLFGLYDGQDEDAPDEDDERSRAEAVVANLRPYVESHGGRIEVVAAENGVVNIRLLGGCESCSGSAATLRGLVEEALRAGLPEFVGMNVSAPPPRGTAPPQRPAPVLIPLSTLSRSGQVDQPPGGCGSGRGCGSQDHGCPGCR
jgi:Fe-S cluster biogenesis protein NfuA